MCVIIACPKNLPSLEILKTCEENNKDGGGIAYPKDGMIYYEKGLDAKEIHRHLLKLKNVRPAVIHFRISTVGGKSTGLCHPFPIDVQAGTGKRGIAEAVLFHNGHWTKWKETLTSAFLGKGAKVPKGDWSDSRAMAWLLGNYGIEMMDFLEIFRDRIAILGKNKKIKLYGEFEEKDGIYYSNTYWDRGKSSFPIYSGGSYNNWPSRNCHWDSEKGNWVPNKEDKASKKDEGQSSQVPILLTDGDDKEYEKAVEKELEKSTATNSDLTGEISTSQTVGEHLDEVLAEQKKTAKIGIAGRNVTLETDPTILPCFSPDKGKPRFFCAVCTFVFKDDLSVPCFCGKRLILN
jgi:hypothetical protein